MLKKFGNAEFKGKMRQIKGDSGRTAADTGTTQMWYDGEVLLSKDSPTQEHKSG